MIAGQIIFIKAINTRCNHTKPIYSTNIILYSRAKTNEFKK